MIRVLIEVSLPASTIGDLRAAAASLAPFRTTLDPFAGSFGCESPARGGRAEWTPCWISAEADDRSLPEVAGALRKLKDLIYEAAKEGGLELLQIPANVQIDDGFYRVRDLLDVLPRLT